MRIRLVIAGLAVGLMAVASAASAQSLRFGAGQQGSQNYGVNAALAQAIGSSVGAKVSVQSFGGPTAYLPLLDEGELDMAAVVMPDLGDAVRGTGPFKDRPLKSLRLVAALMPSPVGMMVRADSGIETTADLKGKRVAWGMPAQASLQPYVEGALANGGLTSDDIKPVPVASVGNGVAALISGNVDATLFALRGGKVVEADAALGGIKWLSFDSSAEAVARMQAIAPEAYILDIPTDAGVTGVKAPLATMAYDYALVTREGFDDETVAAVARLLKEKRAEVAGSNPILGALSDEAVARAYKDVPHHPAASAALGQN